MSKVYITGVGVNSPIGCSFEECISAIRTGTKGISNLQNIDTHYFPTTFAAEVKNKGKILQTAANQDRKGLFISQALQELYSKNNFNQRYSPENLMLVMGAGIDYFDFVNYVNSQENNTENWKNYCYRSSEVVKVLAQQYNIKGGHHTNVSACVASSQALGLSFRIIKEEKSKAIISGGFDSMLSHLHYTGFYKLGALSNWEGAAEEACRPFDKKRCGLVIGEGGIALLLENEENARKEDILAEICGYSTSLDSYMITDPEPNGTFLAKAALEAIEEAGITPDDIDCAHLHETGTYKNALAESKAMQLIFKDRFKEIPVYSMKGQIGHLIGACGAMEFLGIIYSLIYQQVPHTVNFEFPDPEVPLNIIKNKPFDMKIKYILKLNAAFGGQNTALVIKKYS